MREPTAAEVQRELDQFRADMRDDRNQVRNHLDTLKARVVFADVYAADERRRQGELAGLRDAHTRLEAWVKDQVTQLSKAAENEREAAKAERERRASNRKWVIAGILLPIGGVLAELINALRGLH